MLHVRDLDLGKLLAMTLLPSVVRAPLELEDDDLFCPAVPHDLGNHLGALHRRLPGPNLLAVAREQHVIKGNLAARFARQMAHLEYQTLLSTELLAGGFK